MRELAEKNGIHKNTFSYRVRNGMSEYEAATTPLKKIIEVVNMSVEVRRKYAPSMIALAASNGIKYPTFCSRVKKGMSEEEAATKPVMTYQEIGAMKNRKRAWQ